MTLTADAQKTYVGRVAAMTDTDRDLYVPDWLNEGYYLFVQRCGLGNVELTEVALTAGQASYDINTLFGVNIVAIEELYASGTNITGRHYLEWIDQNDWEFYRETTVANGIPTFYNTLSNTIRFYWTPDSSQTIGGVAVVRPAAATGSSTFSAIPVEYQRAPSYYALAQAYLDDNREDDAERAEARFEKLIDRCIAYLNKQGKRRPQPLRPRKGYREGRLTTYWTRMAGQ